MKRLNEMTVEQLVELSTVIALDAVKCSREQRMNAYRDVRERRIRSRFIPARAGNE